jgi:hypothetical protein
MNSQQKTLKTPKTEKLKHNNKKKPATHLWAPGNAVDIAECMMTAKRPRASSPTSRVPNTASPSARHTAGSPRGSIRWLSIPRTHAVRSRGVDR